MSGEKSKKNSVGKPGDSKSKDNKSKHQKTHSKSKSKDGDEEMTVVVPPPKADTNGDIEMNGTDEPVADVVDPKVKATQGWYIRNRASNTDNNRHQIMLCIA